MAVRVYSTLTRRTEDFEPIEPGKVRMYCCGPTVYDFLGIHNARTFVVFDVIRRYLEYRGFDVTFAQNVTDIEDKIIRRARENGRDPIAWAKEYAERYFEDMAKLGVRHPDVTPYATSTIPEMQALILRLLEVGAAYETKSGIYYRVESFPAYGKLSNRTAEEVRAGARVEVDDEKQDPRDFALWKRAKPDEPAWDSPWGPGRPGWHVECSSMVMKHLGESIDIHAGGADLVFPHHENEIAQSEKATGKPFARYWLHGGLLRVGGERMGKSMGNFVRVRDAVRLHPAEAIRMFFLSTHYRKPLEYTDTAIPDQVGPVARLNRCIDDLGEAASGVSAADVTPGDELAVALSRARERFVAAGDDDFNFPGAIGVLFDFVRAANRYLAGRDRLDEREQGMAASARDFLVQTVGGVFGLREEACAPSLGRVAPVLALVVEWRRRAREKQAWATADVLRGGLLNLGVTVEDGREGSSWELKPDADEAKLAAGAMELLLELRAKARAERDWQAADELRAGLEHIGIVLEDSRAGTRWEWAASGKTDES